MIEINNLRKLYDGHEALKGLSFSIDKGEFYGLLGPNGAGKTTTISIMSSILQPDSGEVVINGFSIHDHPVKTKQMIGVVPQEIALYNDLTAFENLMFWGSLYPVPKAELKAQAQKLLNLFGLFDRRNDAVGTYSGGMKRRINIAAALLHKPEVLFMDEPTVGIDPQSRNLIFEVVEQLHKEGITIVYTTHYMEEAERFCDRIGIIDNGQIIAGGTLDELRRDSHIREVISITINNGTEELEEKLRASMHDLEFVGDKIHFYSSDAQAELSKAILLCNQAGADISQIEIQKTNLETIFLNLTGRQLRD